MVILTHKMNRKKQLFNYIIKNCIKCILRQSLTTCTKSVTVFRAMTRVRIVRGA